MISKENILKVLSKVFDPEIPVNLVDLGLIYDIVVNDQTVNIKMTLTATGCPMISKISDDVKLAVKSLEGISEVEVEIVWEPRWNPEMISPAGRIALGMP